MERSKRDASDSPSGGAAPTPPEAADPAAVEETEEPAAVERWEDQGGRGEEAPAGATAAPGVAAEPDYRDRWLRAEAELQNFRRRAARDREEGRRAAEESVLLELVAVLDDLERALASTEVSGPAPAWIEGVTLVAQRIRDYLGRQGVTVEDPVGRPFDPAFHEALLEVDPPAGADPGTVVSVVHKGYRRGDRALRAARVVVARAAAGSAS